MVCGPGHFHIKKQSERVAISNLGFSIPKSPNGRADSNLGFSDSLNQTFSATKQRRMFASCTRKSIPCVKKAAASILYDAHIHNFPSISFRRCITSHLPLQQEHSFAVSYLVNSLAFSEEAAQKLESSRHLRFKTPEKLDLAVQFYINYGFSKTQVSNIIRKYPQLFVSNPEKTFLPKLEFLCSKGLTRHDLVNLISSNPDILRRSLDKCIIPIYHFFKTVLGSDENVLNAFKRSNWNWHAHSQSCGEANIAILLEHGVPRSNIIYMLSRYPKILMSSIDQFRTVVEEVNALGIDPLKLLFVLAIRAKCSMNTSTWKSKLNVYSKWGWSDREIMLAFTKQPSCVLYSEEKINATMNFLTKKMGWEASLVAEHPSIISRSLEKLIIPRCAVITALFSEGLIEKNISMSSLFVCTENIFLRRYVTRYEEKVPHLLNLYQQKMALAT